MPENGFLTDDAKLFQSQFRTRHPALFSLLASIEAHARFLLGEFRLGSEEVQGILIAGYFSRAIDNAHAAVVLAECGLTTQGRILSRAALESQFSLRACLSGEFCEKLVAADITKRKKMLRKMENLSKVAKVPRLDEMLASEKIKKFEDETLDLKAHDIPIAEIARAGGCHDLYLGIYTTLSAAVHSTVYDIERALVVSDDGRVLALTSGPDMTEASGIIVGGVEVLLNVSMAAAAYLDLDFMDYWRSTHDELRRIAESMLAES